MESKFQKFHNDESEFVDWVDEVEPILNFYDTIEEMKVKLMEKRLKGSVADWWIQTKIH